MRRIPAAMSALLLLLLLLLAVAPFPACSALDDEGLALLQFKEGISQDPKGALNTWRSTDTTPCTWSGVLCDADGNVTRILLQGLGLSGTISPELSRLSHLRYLVLSENRLSGTVPSQLSLISSLWKLNVSVNSLSGNLPQELGALGHLRMLDMSDNSFSGPIPSTFFRQCGRLRYVDFSKNNFTGQLPSLLGGCQRLVGIDMSRNMFQGSIPEQFGGLLSLTYLSLSSNILAGVIPQSLGNCSSLNYLDVSKNQLTGPVPTSFADLQSIALFWAGENLLSGGVPAGILYHPNLQSLNFSFNTLSGSLPDGGACAALRMLDLSTNKLTGPLPASLVSCAELQSLNLSSNQLSGLLPSQMSKLTAVQAIDLSSNNFIGEIPSQIGSLNNLSVLRLGSNPGINGSIPPEIGKLLDLRILDLHNMDLQGEVPSALSELSFLSELNLSYNNLTGTIPEVLSNATLLTVLDLKGNKLSGSIPQDLGKLSHLEELDLSINQLSGEIPPALGNVQTLSFLNLSDNRLSGPIPRNDALQRFNASSFLGNAGLCGTPLAVSCSVTAPTPSPSPSRGRRAHVLAASAIAAIAATAIIALGVVIIFVMNFRALRRITEDRIFESTPPSPDTNPILGKLVLFSKTLPARYDDWEAGSKALLDKDSVIGSGTFGTVYKATFDAGVSMAVKKLETLGRIKNAEEFEEEIGRLANVRHPNVVCMQGYFWSPTMQLLLSDFVSNGSLFNHLHQLGAGFGQLTWARRFKIAAGTARGLAYLHHDCRPQILHLNLKSSNILLDHEFMPLISDYGLSKISPVLDTYVTSRQFYSALGYVAPEVACQSIRLSDRCDVYSFGVILLELATGRHPVENSDTDCILLCDDVKFALERGRGPSVIDPDLGPASQAEVMQVLKLGLVCTSQTPSKRPSMAEVVQVLESIQSGNDTQQT